MNRSRLMVFIACILVIGLGQAVATPTTPLDLAIAVENNNAFAVDLYGQLKTQPGNLFFSPESISTALAMTYAGARGETAAEMAKTLHFTQLPEILHPAMSALLHDLNATHDGYQLAVANALWVQSDFHLRDDFMNLESANYKSAIYSVDFKNAAEAARQQINGWVQRQTENKIKDLIMPGVLNSETRLVLTNAIFFKGAWMTSFLKEDTTVEDFHLSSTEIVKIPLMHLTDVFNYFDGGTFQMLELPYEKNELSMRIFLPKDANGLAALDESMRTNMKTCSRKEMSPRHVTVTMPRFRMEGRFDLKGTLQRMGMGQAFDEQRADFTGMAPRTEMQYGNLFIGAMIHKAYVDVNEQGTEAAAVSAVTIKHTRIVPKPPPPVDFRADHPFLFLICNNRFGDILFMGRMMNPSF